MTSRFRFALPARGSGTRLPAILALTLGAAAAFQLLMPGAAKLPVGGAVARTAALPAIGDPRQVVADGQFAARSLFAPRAGNATGGAMMDPLGGATFAGVVQVQGRRYALVQFPDGQVRRVGVGATVSGWRVISLGQAAASLRRGAEQMQLAYGQSAAALGASGDEESEEE